MGTLLVGCLYSCDCNRKLHIQPEKQKPNKQNKGKLRLQYRSIYLLTASLLKYDSSTDKVLRITRRRHRNLRHIVARKIWFTKSGISAE